MALRLRNETTGVLTGAVAGDVITGIILNREIQNGVKVRPTNVTAVISFTVDSVEYDVIVLQNGPKGGFTQDITIPTAASNIRGNEVIQAVLTNSNS